MPFKQNADKSFLYAAPPDKAGIGQHIIDSIGANGGVFNTSPYTISEMQAANDELGKYVGLARGGSHNDIAQRNRAEKAWNTIFGKMAGYVSFAADGDASIITLAGMTPTKADATPKPVPGSGRLKSFALHSSGVAEIDMESLGAGATAAYMYLAIPADAQVSTGGDGTITITLTDGAKVYAKCDTHRSVMMGDMESGTALKLVVQPVNSTGAGEASAPRSFTPQP